jgi:Helix-turn-helix domain
MNLNLLTGEEFVHFKKELFQELKKLVATQESSPRLMKSKEVCKILHMSPGKLQRLRDTGQIEFIDMGKKYLYDSKHIQRIIAEKTKRKGASCIVYSILVPCMYWLSSVDHFIA